MYRLMSASVILAGCLLVSIVVAGEHAGVTDPLAEARTLAESKGYELGEKIRRIENYKVDGWVELTDQALILRGGVKRRYLVTLKIKCWGLRGARGIATTSTARALTDFDAIIVSGRGSGTPMRCPVDSIYELNEKVEADPAVAPAEE